MSGSPSASTSSHGPPPAGKRCRGMRGSRSHIRWRRRAAPPYRLPEQLPVGFGVVPPRRSSEQHRRRRCLGSKTDDAGMHLAGESSSVQSRRRLRQRFLAVSDRKEVGAPVDGDGEWAGGPTMVSSTGGAAPGSAAPDPGRAQPSRVAGLLPVNGIGVLGELLPIGVCCREWIREGESG